MTFELDSKKWDIYHKKTLSEDTNPSKYAMEKEMLFPRQSIVVDLGGGVGSDAMYFLEKGHSVIILDISQFALDVAMERAKAKKLDEKLIVKQVDFALHSIPIKIQSADIAYSRLSLNYFDLDETTVLIHDIYGILKQGGNAFLTFKSPDDIEEIEYLKKRATAVTENVFIDNGQIRSRFSLAQLELIAKNAGITKYEVKPYTEDVVSETGEATRTLICNELSFTKT